MSFLQAAFLKVKSPIYEIKRFRGKINIQRPRKPHFTRQVVIDACVPKLEKKSELQIDQCTYGQKHPWGSVDNPFEHILAKECLNWFNHSKMIIFYHINPVVMDEKSRVYSDLKMENMTLRTYGRKIVSMAVKGTPYEAVNALFTSHTNILFSETVQIHKLFKITRKIPQLVLMAGVVDGQLLSKNEIMEYSKLPSIDVARSQLCNVLQSTALNLVSQLNQHQSGLVTRLDQYVTLKQTPSELTESSTQKEEQLTQEKTISSEPKE